MNLHDFPQLNITDFIGCENHACVFLFSTCGYHASLHNSWPARAASSHRKNSKEKRINKALSNLNLVFNS